MTPPAEDEPAAAGPVPLAPSPTDAVVLRETADGWIDLDRARFQRSGGRDLPDMTPNTRAILVDGDGSGLLLGGVSDASTTPVLHGRPGRRRPSAAWLRCAGSNAVPSRPSPGAASETGETPAPPGSVRLAVGGHPACLDRCGGAGGQGYAPDTHLQSAVARVRAMSAGGAGPAALLDRRRARLARRRAARPRRSAPLPRAHAGRRRADVRPARSGRPAERRRGGVRLGLRHRARAAGHG